MGLKAAEKLRDAGHTVIGVDVKESDIVADLSSVEGRRAAADGVLAAAGADWTARFSRPASAPAKDLTVRG